MLQANNLANSRLKYDLGTKMTMFERQLGYFASRIRKAASMADGFPIIENGLLLCGRIVRNRRFFLFPRSGSILLRLEPVNHLVGIGWKKINQLLAKGIEHRLGFGIGYPCWLVGWDKPVEEQHGNDHEKHATRATEQEA